MKKIILGIFVLAIATVFAVPALAKSDNAKGPAPKVDVCHFEGNGSYHVINVSENALPAHQAHGDFIAGVENEPVPFMDEGYYFTGACEYEFVRSAVITSPAENDPYTEYDVGEEVDFIAHLVDMDKDDGVSWAVRFESCNANTNTVFGNVDGFHDDYDWDHTNFSAIADTTDWEGGDYCFVFNPSESAGDTGIRLTRWFTLNQTVCEYSVDATEEEAYLGLYGSTVTPVTITNEDCSTTDALKVEHSQNFQANQPEGGSAGWAGWSCVQPGFPNVVGGGYNPDDADVLESLAWEEGANVGIDNYPTTPWGYTYGPDEEGWIVQGAGTNPPTSTYALCVE